MKFLYPVYGKMRENFLNSDSPNEKLARKLLPIIQDIIKEEGTPYFTRQKWFENGDDTLKKKYVKSINDYTNDAIKIESHWQNDCFFDKEGSCFGYNNDIIISDKKNSNHFELLFVCALRQYDENLKEIKYFLNFHLNRSYKKQINSYIEFLQICILQHSNFLSEKIVFIVNEWIKDNIPKNEINPSLKKKSGINNIQVTNEEKLKEADKKVIYDSLKPLSGYWKREKIMNDEEFIRLVEYVNYLVFSEKTPQNITPIKQTKISNDFIRKTMQKLHFKFYGRRKRQYWIDFIHMTFSQFSKTERTTTDKLFSSYKKTYDLDLQEITYK